MEIMLRLGAVLAGSSLALMGVVGASAHDVHPFGKFTVALGWLHEPAYVGSDNAVQVLVKDQAGNAFTGITDKDLTVELSVGNQKQAAKPLVPTADPDTGLGIPGEYEYHVIPTVPGAYTFHLKGTVGGQTIDETVTAGDKTFNLVTAASEAQWPNQIPSAADLSTKLDRLSSRQASTQSNADAAQSAANRALIVAIVGIVIALVLGGVALITRRRP
jgi:outer membrane murein-binding lipoprotein Lpp